MYPLGYSRLERYCPFMLYEYNFESSREKNIILKRGAPESTAYSTGELLGFLRLLIN